MTHKSFEICTILVF